LWRIGAKEGDEPEVLANTGQGRGHFAISSHGALVYAQRTSDLDIWVVELARPGAEAGPPVRLISSTRNDWVPSYSPDGNRIAFTSSRSGYSEIYVCDRNGEHVSKLTNFQGPLASTIGWSPDGKWIVFGTHEEARDIFVMSDQGTGQRKLTTHPGYDAEATFSRDGKSIYFTSERSGEAQVWKIPFEGGEAVQVTQQGGREPQESLDGAVIYYKFEDTIWKKPVKGGEETQVFDTLLRTGIFCVTATGIYFLPTEPKGISFYDFATKTVSSVMANDKLSDWGIWASADGLRILYTEKDPHTDLMLVKNFR
jgi:Tol biopolymer transport system component